MSFRTTSKGNLIAEYNRIATSNSTLKIAFYRKNEGDICKIPIDERLEIEKDFLFALFQNGEFQDYLDRCENLIAQLFDVDIFPEFDQESLSTILFHKAACQYNLHDHGASKNTMKQLIRIDTSSKRIHLELLARIFMKEQSGGKYVVRGVIIAMILVSAVLSVWNVLVIQPFFPEYFKGFQVAGWSVLILALGLWSGTWYYNRVTAKKEAHRLLEVGSGFEPL